MASIECLTSGLEVFNPAFDERERSNRLIQGIHGFHIYATEFWTEYVLTEAAFPGTSHASSLLVRRAIEFSQLLHAGTEDVGILKVMEDVVISDRRLSRLQPWDSLYQHVAAAMRCRSRKRLEMELLQAQSELITSHLYRFYLLT